MATIKLFQPFSFISGHYWEKTSHTPDSLIFETGARKLVCSGELSFAGNAVAGTVSKAVYSVDQAQVYEITGLSVDASMFGSETESSDWFATAFAGDDTMVGSAGNDDLKGYTGNDNLNGGAGRDQLSGDAGDDVLDGGEGDDTALYFGRYSDYKVTRTADGFTVVDMKGNNGSDTVYRVEELHFSDKYVITDPDVDGAMGQAVRMYQAAFDRVPNGLELGYWRGVLEHGLSVEEMAGGFGQTFEFGRTLGSLGNREFVLRLYDNAMHRTPGQGELDYWVSALDHNDSTRAELLYQFSESAESIQNCAEFMANGLPIDWPVYF